MGKRRRVSFFKIHKDENRDGNSKFVKVHVNRRKNGKDNTSVVEVYRSGIMSDVWDVHRAARVVYFSQIVKRGALQHDESIVWCPFEEDSDQHEGENVYVQTRDIPTYLEAIIEDVPITGIEYDEWQRAEEESSEDTVGVWLYQENVDHRVNPKTITQKEILLDKRGLVGYVQDIFGSGHETIIVKVVSFPKRVTNSKNEVYYTAILFRNSDGNIVKIAHTREEEISALTLVNQVVVHYKLSLNESFKSRCPTLISVSDVVRDDKIMSVTITMSTIGKTLDKRARDEDDKFVSDLRTGKFQSKLKALFISMRDAMLVHNNLHLGNIYETVSGEYGVIDFEYSQFLTSEIVACNFTYDWMRLYDDKSVFKSEELQSIFKDSLENVHNDLINDVSININIDDDDDDITTDEYFRTVVYPNITKEYHEIGKRDQLLIDYGLAKTG